MSVTERMVALAEDRWPSDASEVPGDALAHNCLGLVELECRNDDAAGFCGMPSPPISMSGNSA